jgi:putative endonuclease
LNPSGPFWVYVLQNPGGRFYIGHTDDLTRRVEDHNSSLGHMTFTHKNGPWTLVWSESHPTRSAAVVREKQIKSMKSAKWIRENLLNGRVPTRRD